MLYEVLDAHDKGPKQGPWHGILVHHTDVGGKKTIDDSMWSKLSRNITNYLAAKDESYVSAHYTIWRDGKISQLVNPDTHCAWHAGKSAWWNPATRVFSTGCNSNFIGIELVGDGNLHAYSDEQYEALSSLAKHLMAKYPSIHPCCVVGHEMVSPGRKVDPGKLFDWRKFYAGLYKV